MLSFAVDVLSTAPSSQLPVVTRFLLETADTASAQQVLLQVRRKIGDYLDVSRHNATIEDRTCHTLLIGIFKSCFQAQPTLLSSYCELLMGSEAHSDGGTGAVISKDDPEEDHVQEGNGSKVTRAVQTVDMWVLFSLAGAVSCFLAE